jgi:hypothetical protein
MGLRQMGDVPLFPFMPDPRLARRSEIGLILYGAEQDSARNKKSLSERVNIR